MTRANKIWKMEKKVYTKINQNQIYVTRGGGGGAGETIKILCLIINKIGCTISLYNLSYLSYPHKQIMSFIKIFLLHRASERCAGRRRAAAPTRRAYKFMKTNFMQFVYRVYIRKFCANFFHILK